MKHTTIAITAETKRALDPHRTRLSKMLDTKVSYSYTIKYLLENDTTDHARSL